MAGTSVAATAHDVVARRAFVLDFDNKDARSTDPDWSCTVEGLEREGIAALIVNSGNGVHIWIPLTDADTPE